MKKFIFILLAIILASLLILGMTSCNNPKNETANDKNNGENAQPPDGLALGNDGGGDTGAEAEIREEIPDLDFKGKTFTILAPKHGLYMEYYFAEEENTGDKMDDALWRRQTNVESRFNITIEPIIRTTDIKAIFGMVKKSILADDDAYQLVLTHNQAGVYELSCGGFVQDWNTIPIIDLEKPWWTQRMNDALTVNGALLPATSDFILFDPLVIYFNKRMAQEFDMGDIYQIVRDGKWTWTKLTELAKQAPKDLNGDGKMNKEDQYGLVTHVGWRLLASQSACDMYQTRIGDDGYPEYALKNEKYGNLLNMLYELIFDGNQTFRGDWNDSYVEDPPITMGSDRALFIIDPLCSAKRYRVYDVEFGILPYPKYDDAQQGYFSYSQTGFMMIPNTADPEFVGAVSEALAAESYRLTVPAYYDVVLTSKLARDEESVDMIDIIFRGATTDFGQVFSNWHALGEALPNILAKKSTDYVSFIEKHEESYNKHIRGVYDQIRDHYGN